MERRHFLAAAAGVGAVAGTAAGNTQVHRAAPSGAADRRYMVELLTKMAAPILGPMSQGRLQKTFQPALSPSWDGRNPKVAYLEAFGRLLSGIAPWLALPEDGTAEGLRRKDLQQKALASLAHAVDPASPDYLLWRREGQPLVDSAFFTQALLRAPKQLWEPLDVATKRRVVAEIKQLRRVTPPYTNWLLFAAMNEAFLLSIGEDWDPMRVDLAVRKVTEWYVGDGWYADGPRFHFDFYGAYVLHPMLTQVLDVATAAGSRIAGQPAAPLREQAYRRMQRYAEQLERMIGPDGSYPPIGRSLTYRTAVFQPLALLALRKRLPPSLPTGQVRAATMAAQRAIFSNPTNFDAAGYLTIGFAGAQPALGDVYSNAGSMYIAAESLLALGLPADDAFWVDPPIDWTARRAFAGRSFAKDHYIED